MLLAMPHDRALVAGRGPTGDRAPAGGDDSLWSLVRGDLLVWQGLFAPGRGGGRLSWATAAYLLLTYVGARATLLYRLAHHAQRRGLRGVPMVLTQLNLILHGFDIVPSIPIGPGLYVPHPVGTVVMARRLGTRVTLVSGVTIGMRKGHAFPAIGDDVYIGAGARVLGDITIGDRVSIGANAVVTKDVPSDSVAVGVPATVRPAAPPQELPTSG
jgi:serine O-acetyltransferase